MSTERTSELMHQANYAVFLIAESLMKHGDVPAVRQKCVTDLCNLMKTFADLTHVVRGMELLRSEIVSAFDPRPAMPAN